MSKWIDLDLAERRVILQSVENKEKLQQAAAIEKDWWVTAVLKALFQTSCKEALSFKDLCIATHKPFHMYGQPARVSISTSEKALMTFSIRFTSG